MRRCKNRCGAELPTAAKCTDIIEREGFCSKECKLKLTKEKAAKKKAKPPAPKKAKKSRRSVKIKPSDEAFAKCIKQVANWTCEKCGKTDARMECSHIFSRRHRTIRWCKDNAMCKCSYCHQWWHSNPLDAASWFLSVVGQGFVDLLIEKRDSKVRVSKLEEVEIAAHYRAELKKLESGEISDFESWQ